MSNLHVVIYKTVAHVNLLVYGCGFIHIHRALDFNMLLTGDF